MSSDFKISIILGLFAMTTAMAQAQNNNPYHTFGYCSTVRYEEPKRDYLSIANTNTQDSIRGLVFDFNKKTVLLLDAHDSIVNTLSIHPTELLRWASLDPLASKYPASSPYNFVDDNPIVRMEVDGQDWIVCTSIVNGKTQIHLTFVAAIINNSENKSINMKTLIGQQMDVFRSVFGQGNVTAQIMLREIKSINDLKPNESLIEIRKGDDEELNRRNAWGFAGVGGKYIVLNGAFINNRGYFEAPNTMIHEIGHTGGLMHAFEFGEPNTYGLVNGAPFSMGVQAFSVTTFEEATNFMGYQDWSLKEAKRFYPPWSGKKGISNILGHDKFLEYGKRSEIDKREDVRVNVGKATQGQTLQIINNVYDGNLNYNNIPTSDVERRTNEKPSK